MSTIEAGTRSWANTQLTVQLPTRKFDRGYSRDVGLSKAATGAFVFNAGAGTVTLAGAFTNFAFNDDLLFEGTANNNGFFKVQVTGSNVITLNPSPVSETAPATATVRSA